MAKRQHIPTVIVSYGFLRRGDDVFLMKRANTGYRDNEFGPPAGHLEGMESPVTAVVREVLEEAGVNTTSADWRLVHMMQRAASDHRRLDLFFEATRWEGEPYNAEPEKCSEVGWYAISDLPKTTIDYCRHALLQMGVGENYSEFTGGDNVIFNEHYEHPIT